VQSNYGALAGAGTLGAGTAPGTFGVSGQSGSNPRTQVQTSSAGISPYLLSQFKDYGTGKLGVSVDASHYSAINGFVANPFASGGTNSQSLLTTEQIAQFTSGEFFGRFQDAFSADFLQSTSQSQAGAGTTAPNFSSQRDTVTNQISYVINRTFTVLASIGEQKIQYGGTVGPNVNGLTWKAGITVTPNQDSSITVSYGHINGATDLQADGHIALGGRSLLSFDYSDTVGTQLESLQNQLANSAINVNGQSINAQTGGPSFTAQNAVGVQAGVFRFDTFNVSLATSWLRDTLQASATWSVQTNLTPGSAQLNTFIDPVTGHIVTINQPATSTGQSVDIKTASLEWLHELSPDLTLNSGASYSYIRRSGSLGNDGSLAASLGLQYALSASSTVTARYSFFDRISKIPGYSLYENVLILGFTKQF
jgi:uncharacterized protein (PEP-CTERM system associated)